MTVDRKEETGFETLLNKKINISRGDLVFYDKDNEVINLAGIVGGLNSACDKNTKSVIVECAYFNPEAIIGKSLLDVTVATQGLSNSSILISPLKTSP